MATADGKGGQSGGTALGRAGSVTLGNGSSGDDDSGYLWRLQVSASNGLGFGSFGVSEFLFISLNLFSHAFGIGDRKRLRWPHSKI